MEIVQIPLNKHFMPFGNVFPYEIQHLIFEFRNKILEKEREAIIRSLSKEEHIKGLCYNYDKMIAQSVLSQNPKDQAAVVSKVAKSAYKIHGRIFMVISYDIGDIMEGIDLIVNLERLPVSDGQSDAQEDPIVSYWDGIDEVERGIQAAQCFDAMNTNDIERLRQTDDDEFIHFAEYCFDIFRGIYNNREA